MGCTEEMPHKNMENIIPVYAIPLIAPRCDIHLRLHFSFSFLILIVPFLRRPCFFNFADRDALSFRRLEAAPIESAQREKNSTRVSNKCAFQIRVIKSFLFYWSKNPAFQIRVIKSFFIGQTNPASKKALFSVQTKFQETDSRRCVSSLNSTLCKNSLR